MAKNCLISDWEVSNEESLSDHRYIIFYLNFNKDIKFINKKSKRVVDYLGTNWTKFRNKIGEYRGKFIRTDEDLELEAENFQKFCVLVCKKFIKRKIINNDIKKDWWNNDLNLKKKRNEYCKKEFSNRKGY